MGRVESLDSVADARVDGEGLGFVEGEERYAVGDLGADAVEVGEPEDGLVVGDVRLGEAVQVEAAVEDALCGLDDGVRDTVEAEGHFLQLFDTAVEDCLCVGEGVAGLTVEGQRTAQLGCYLLDAVGDSGRGCSCGADIGDEAFPWVGLPHEADAGVFLYERGYVFVTGGDVRVDGVEVVVEAEVAGQEAGEVGVGG